MYRSISFSIAVAASLFAAESFAQGTNVSHPMGFFVTSVGLGDGGNLGGLAGAAVGVYMDKQEEKLRQQTAGTGIGVERVGDQIALSMPSGLTFDVDSSTIKGDFYGPLNDVSATLQEYPKTAVDVVGHASSDGDDAYNQQLSERRATSVQTYLSNNGVQSVRLNAIGMGENQPIADNSTQAGRAANRRVEILLTPIVEDGA